MKRLGVVLSVMIALNSPALAQSEAGAIFLLIAPGARAGGMGDAGTALSPNSTSVYWNTSVLSFSEQTSEVSLSYTPWLRQLTNDIHLSYLSGYYKINKSHTIGGALRYFSLGEITFTDASGNVIRDDKPSEFEITGAYAFRLSRKLSLGINGKFAYSNLTGGLTVGGVNTKPGVVGAADLSFTYYNDDAKIGNLDGVYTFATTINNIGNKVSYSELATRDFIPMNLKIGNSFLANFDAYNKVTFSLEAEEAENVSVVGSFNEWDDTAAPLKKLKNGTFKTVVNLETGRDYAFRYVIDGEMWENDWAADAYKLNGLTFEENSIVSLS